jgi:hypothetical protein
MIFSTGPRLAVALGVLVGACGAPPAAGAPEAPPCAEFAKLGDKATAAARESDRRPSDAKLQETAIEAARALAFHVRGHQADLGDPRPAVALAPTLQRVISSDASCEQKRDIGRIELALFHLMSEAAQVFMKDARPCVTGLDAASIGNPLVGGVDKADLLLLIKEVWPRSTRAEYLALLDALSNVSHTDAERKRNFDGVPSDVLLEYEEILRQRKLQQNDAETRRRLGGACHDTCLSIYGMGDTVCGKGCHGESSCVRMCEEQGEKCHADCDR